VTGSAAPVALSGPAQQVARDLGLGEQHASWLAELDAVAPEELPAERLTPTVAGPLLERLGCNAQAVEEATANLPDRERTPALWWVLERSRRRLVETMGDSRLRVGREWPPLPPALGAAARCFSLHLFAATVPDTRRHHASWGVPDDVSWATLADLGRHQRIAWRSSGAVGVDAPWWVLLHLRSRLLEVGRLQYVPYRMVVDPEHPSTWYDADELRRLGEGFRAGDAALDVHIPEGDALDPAACGDSLRRARDLFERLDPSPVRRIATCSSWLLDPQLADYLPDEANIIRFQRRFRLAPGWVEGDGPVLDFVFRNRGDDPDGPPRTRLQRIVAEHLSGGHHFHWRSGWIDLTTA